MIQIGSSRTYLTKLPAICPSQNLSALNQSVTGYGEKALTAPVTAAKSGLRWGGKKSKLQ
jgi:hypothetical protein